MVYFYMVRKTWIILFLLSSILFISSCGDRVISGTESGVYNRYNLHFISMGRVNKGSYKNWTDYSGHSFIPYNTRLDIRLRKNRIKFTTNNGLVV